MKLAALPVVLLVLSVPMFAQSSTTYNVVQPYASGRATTPTRIFYVGLNQGASISWLELGQGTACSGQTSPPLGFIFIKLQSGALPCARVMASSNGSCGLVSATFRGADNNGLALSGTVNLISVCHYRRGGGGKGGGGAGTYYTITSGSLTIIQ